MCEGEEVETAGAHVEFKGGREGRREGERGGTVMWIYVKILFFSLCFQY